jgi:hypothetical protein
LIGIILLALLQLAAVLKFIQDGPEREKIWKEGGRKGKRGGIRERGREEEEGKEGGKKRGEGRKGGGRRRVFGLMAQLANGGLLYSHTLHVLMLRQVS